MAFCTSGNPLARLIGLILLALGLNLAGLPPVAAQGSPGGLREISIAPSAFVRGTPLPGWFRRQDKLPEGDRREPRVIRLADSHFRVETTPRVVVHRALQGNEASALPELGQSSIEFNPAYQRVELHWLKIHRGDEVLDRLAGASLRFFNTERNVDQGIYVGMTTAVVITQDLRPGDTLEMIYSVIGQNPVFGGRFAEAASWDAYAPTLLRRVTLDAPRGRPIRHRVVGGQGEAPQAVESDLGERHLVRYEKANLAAVAPEALIPSGLEALRWVQFAEARDWREVEAWARDLFTVKGGAPLALPPELRAPLAPEEALMRALIFVQDNIRYLSMSIGENSHRPYPPAEVLARRYGDCKDKSLLLVTLLRQLGIQAEPVLLATSHRKGLGDLLASPALFDHAIVRVTLDGRSHYFDPTAQGQGSSLASLGRTFPETDVLVVGAADGRLAQIPAAPAPDTALVSRFEKVSIARLDEPAEMQVEVRYRGDDAEGARQAIARMGPAQFRKIYEGMLDRRYPRAQLQGEPEVRDDRAANQLLILARYRIPGFLERQEQRWRFSYEASNLIHLLPAPDNGKRRFPLAFPAYPWVGRYSLEVTLPEDFDARYRPSRREIRAGAFTLAEQSSFAGRVIKSELQLNITRDRIAAEETPGFLEERRQANTYFYGDFLFGERDRRVADGGPALRELSRQRLEQLVSNTGRTIAAASASGRATSSARCERAVAEAYLERFEAARQDAELAVAEQPVAAESLRCRGLVRFAGGQFEDSIRDLGRVLALDGQDVEAYFIRGLARYYAGHWKEAGEDFETYRARIGNPQGEARASVWQALAQRRATPGANIEATGGAAWPAPILGVLRGEAGIEEVIDGLNRQERGQQLEEALAEAYLYFHFELATRNPPRARAYLQRAVDLGPLYSLVQVAARHELKRSAGAPR